MSSSSGSGWDRAVRSLVHLDASGSTARTLNLVAVWRRHGEEAEWKAKPFFRNPVLNRSIIVKHRLRANEREMVAHNRSQATKVILPLNIADLRSGARSLFVGERGFAEMWRSLSGARNDGEAEDLRLLNLIDTLPSLDPFLMRERLRKAGFDPARCYLNLTEADAANMIKFAREEIMPLIGVSFGETSAKLQEKTARLAGKILGDAGDPELEPLRLSLSMSKAEFEEGLFCWKGFIYYKWTLSDLLPRVMPVSREIAKVVPLGPASEDQKYFILGARERLAATMRQACDTVRATLRVYDQAYKDLTHNGQPLAFREFLLQAPHLFYELGERLGSVQHVVSFWRFRFPEGQNAKLEADDLIDMLADFELSLNFTGSE